MPVRPLPTNPSIDYLRHEAKDLLKARNTGRPDAAQRIREFHPHFPRASDTEIFNATFKLSDAQLTIAREHGFPSWPRLKARIEKPAFCDSLDLPHHERIADAAFRRAVDLVDAGDAAGLREHLHAHPELARRHVLFEGGNYFRNPTLLQFVAENPTRRGTLPRNAAEVACVIIEHGVTQSDLDETLALVASSDVAHKCGVQGILIDVLCEHGADPNAGLRTAAMYREFAAVEALLRHGARLDLPIAAALGRVEDFTRLLPSSSAEERHWALSLASQMGEADMVRMLLEAGEDPNRYNPVGGHSHGTPLHQAAANGHLELVRLLVKHGAHLDWRDTMWQATPAEWAKHEGKAEVEGYLRAQEIKPKS
jgi:Ankyrin repeats (3 copies)